MILKRNGFTLVELSIVLVIIGLLIGGILVAQSLIKTAQVNKIISQLNQYDVMIGLFKSNYKCLPGDCTSSRGFALSGNGDGKIGADYASYQAGEEDLRLWKMLSDVGYLKESYTGVNGGSAVNRFVPGVNTPLIEGADFEGVILNPFHNHNPVLAAQYGSEFTLGSENIFAGVLEEPKGPSVEADKAATIDQKIDDGVPLTGAVRAMNNINSCVTGSEWNFDTGSCGLYLPFLRTAE